MHFLKQEESTADKAKRDNRIKVAFDAWMSEPMTRFAISTIPPGEHQDALQMLLRAAFENGIELGQVETAIGLFEDVMEYRRKNDRG